MPLPHPKPGILVDRSGALAVGFCVTTRRPTRTTDPWEAVRLRIFLHPRAGQPTKTLIQCNSAVVGRNVEAYLEHHARLQTCP